MLSAHVITVISPQTSDLVGNMIARLQQDLHVSEINWLAQERACDVFVQGTQLDTLRAQLKNMIKDEVLDVIAQPVDNRKKKLLICDMDSTMIEQECIDELADYKGIKSQVADITERAMHGELEFEAALKERVALLKDLPATSLQEVWDTHITLMSGGNKLVGTMKAHGAHAILVSGGFTFFTSRVADALGFDTDFANELEVKDGKLTGHVVEPILDKQSKLFTLHSECHKHRITRDEVLAVGDGANDLPMLQAAGLGVAYHGKPIVQEGAASALNHNDLSALLFVQGYNEQEFHSAEIAATSG